MKDNKTDNYSTKVQYLVCEIQQKILKLCKMKKIEKEDNFTSYHRFLFM